LKKNQDINRNRRIVSYESPAGDWALPPDVILQRLDEERDEDVEPGFVDNQTLLRHFDKLRSDTGSETFDLAVAIATLMVLRWIETVEDEADAIAEFEGGDYERCILPSHAIASWLKVPSDRLVAHLRTVVIPEMLSARHSEYAGIVNRLSFGIRVFCDFGAEIKQKLIESICQIDPSRPSEKALRAEYLDHLFDCAILYEKGYLSGYITPQILVDLMIDLADPEPGDRVYDPCFGTGRLLAAAAFRKQQKVKTTDGSTWSEMRRNGIYGREINERVFLLGLARIVYQGIDLPRLEVGDSLEAPGFNGSSDSGYDCILANPPFNHKVSTPVGHLYPVPMKEGDGLFIQHIVQSLRPGGRAVVVVPPSVLYQAGHMKTLREYLVDQQLLKKVIALPKGILKPYTNVAVNLLILQKVQDSAPIEFLNLNHVQIPDDGRLDADHLRKLPGAFSYEQSAAEIAQRNWDLVVREDVTDEIEHSINDLIYRFPDVAVQPLGKIADLKRGIGYNRSVVTEEPSFGGISQLRLLRVSDVQRGEIQNPRLFLKDGAETQISDEVRLREGDILLTINGTIGKVAFCSAMPSPALASSGIVLIRPKDNTVSREFLFSLLTSDTYQRLLGSLARGATIQSLPLKVLRELPIPIPPINTQAKVARHAIEHQGDAFSHLVRALSKTEDDPFVTWLEEAQEIIQLVDYAKGDSERDRLIVIQRAASSIRSVRNSLTHSTLISTTAAGFFGWLNMLSDAAAKLTSIASIGDLGERFNLLHNASVQCMASSFVLPEEPPSLTKRASLISRSLQQILAREVDVINQEQRIEIECIDEVVPDVISEVTMTIRNAGPLPLRDIEIRDSYSGDVGDYISYLPAKESRSFMIRLFTIDSDDEDGHFFRDIIVTGTRMNDEAFDQDVTVSIKVTDPWIQEINEQVAADVEAVMRDWGSLAVASESLEADSDHERLTLQRLGKNSESAHGSPNLSLSHSTSFDLGYSPYTAGTPVPNRMFGRERILARITRQLSSHGQANVILLEGNRRTGKTSLLERLSVGDLTPEWLPVYVDCQAGDSQEKSPGLPTAEVWRSIATGIAESLIKSGHRSPDFLQEGWIRNSEDGSINQRSRQAFDTDHPFETFKFFLTRALAELAPKRLLLMLDEFDKLQEGVENGITSPQVFQNIRHLVHTHHDLSLILAGTPLLKHLREQHWSALYGFGISIPVSFLEPSDARDLITEPVEKTLRYSEAAIERIIEATNGQPYLIQSLCNSIFLDLAEESTRNVVSLTDAEKAIREMTERGGHFRDLWNFAKTARRRLLLALAQRRSRDGAFLTRATIEEELSALGVFVPKGEGLGVDLEYLRSLELLKLNKHSSSQYYTLLIPIFGEWIEENEDFEDVVERAVVESENYQR